MATMDLIETVTRDLGAAIDRAKGGDPWRPVTVLVPTVVSALQWRRRVARARGGLFRVQWHDPAQFTAELLAAVGEPTRTAPRALQIAAAWKVLQDAPASLSRHAARPELPVQLVQAFRAVENLSEEDRGRVGELISDLYARWIDALAPYGTIGRDRDAAARRLRSGLAPEGAHILLSAGMRTHGEEDYQRAILAIATEVPLLRDGAVRATAEQVHDEADEIERVASLVQDAATGDPGISPSDFAIVVPSRDPWTKWLERSGIPCNGLTTRPLREGAAGAAVAGTTLAGSTWSEVAEQVGAAVERTPAVEAQALRDQADAWAILQEAGFAVDPVLLEALRTVALEQPAPRQTSFGDGVFVGLPQHFTGLAFRRMAVVGVTANRYPSPRRSVPLLPPGLGVPDVAAQRRHFEDLLRAGGDVVLLHARSDRRNGREAFASPWTVELAGEPSVFPSSLDLLARLGPRTPDASILADALRQGRPTLPDAARLLARWESDDSEAESRIDVDLTEGREFSATELETLMACPRRWYLDKCSGMKEVRVEPPDGYDPAAVGTAIHSAMAHLVGQRFDALADIDYAWTPEDLALASDRLVEVLNEGKPDPDRTALRELAVWRSRLARLLSDDEQWRRDNKSRPRGVEVVLEGEIAGLRVKGRCDRIDARIEGGLVVIDYKSGRRPASRNKLEDDPTLGGTLLQGMIYSVLAARAEGADPSGMAEYWHLRGTKRDDRRVELPVDAKHVAAVEDHLAAARDLLREGWIPMRPRRDSRAGLCPWCPWSVICPGDREAIVARQQRGASGAYRRYLNLVQGGTADEGTEGA